MKPRAKSRLVEAPLGRDAARLLLALAQDGAAPGRTDLREGFLVVAAPRAGVTSIIANAPRRAGDELAARRLAEWVERDNGAVLRLLPDGAALARRRAAPPGVDPFLAQHIAVAVRPPAPGERPAMIDERESPLSWLARRKGRDGAAWLDAAQVEAGERFRRDVESARMLPRVTSDWSGVVVSGGRGADKLNVSDLAIAARQRLDRAAAAAGPELVGLLIDVCGFQKGLELVERERAWPPRSAKVVLRIALDRLAAHYGLAAHASGAGVGVRSWAAADYRPTLDTPG